MDDLLKEAIADAKAVRETALENAKIALEEAFTPRLQSMLSKKIQSEIEVEEGEHEDDEEKEEGYHEDDEDPTDDASEAMHDDEEEKEEGYHEDDEDPTDDASEAMHDEDEDDMEEGVIEINGVKYAPVVAETEDDEEEMEEAEHEDEDEMDESDDLDLEAVLRELEEEDSVDEAEEPVEEETETVDEAEDDDEDKEDVDEEVDASTGIGSSDNKTGSADKSSGIGTPGKAKHNESVEVTEEKDEDDEKDVDEDIDLEEVIAALSEEEKEDDEKNEVASLKSDLDEHRNVVKYLRSKLNEVNLLNAKLLFTNKLFRSFGLSNDQKMKVVENFDRAHNLREVKLVYSTLAESFGTKTTKTEIKEHKGSASKAVASTKSEKQEEIISEGSELRDRFKKLAGII